jgi:hypothetical protein
MHAIRHSSSSVWPYTQLQRAPAPRVTLALTLTAVVVVALVVVVVVAALGFMPDPPPALVAAGLGGVSSGSAGLSGATPVRSMPCKLSIILSSSLKSGPPVVCESTVFAFTGVVDTPGETRPASDGVERATGVGCERVELVVVVVVVAVELVNAVALAPALTSASLWPQSRSRSSSQQTQWHFAAKLVRELLSSP